MERINEIFFSNHGLTSTSAAHLADLAQELIAGNEAKLKNLNFVTTKVDIVGSTSDSGKTINIGYDESMLAQVRPLLEEIAIMNAFCAWMREAIKAKEYEIKQVNNRSFEEWCKDNNIEAPATPQYPKEIDSNEIIAQLTIKERNQYFYWEATAATIGKYIHPGGQFANAREELQCKIMKPYDTSGNGKDTLIYSHTPSIDPQKVEDTFFDLQKWHRENERELNKIKFAIKKEAEKKVLERNQQYRQDLEDYTQKRQTLFAQYKQWQSQERERIANLKIVVPEALQTTCDKLNDLEK